jgi:hypothetical protein
MIKDETKLQLLQLAQGRNDAVTAAHVIWLEGVP